VYPISVWWMGDSIFLVANFCDSYLAGLEFDWEMFARMAGTRTYLA